MQAGDLIAEEASEGRGNILARLADIERRLSQLEANQVDQGGAFVADPGTTYTVTNAATDRTYNANSTTVDELADVLATLLSDLGLR